MGKILIIDDDSGFNLMLKTFLTKNGHELEQAFDAKSGFKMVISHRFDLILTDLRLPDIDGIELLKKIKKVQKATPVILMTSYTGIKTAVTAMKIGAFDYITKPINPDETLMVVQSALDQPTVSSEDESTPPIAVQEQLHITGTSTVARQIDDHISLVAPTNMSVIIQGESGTGKEFVSKKIHEKSLRSKAPFVAIDCGALPKDLAGSELFGHLKGAFTGAIGEKKGQFEAAHGGTLFLDEIGNLPYEIQIKLLRAIQERKVRKLGATQDIEVDVRLIAATNEDLPSAVANGTFREDLYHRLNEFKIEVSPLRERGRDIEVFATHFLALSNAELSKSVRGFEPSVIEKFMQYPWHGNLREMKNAVKRATLLAQGPYIAASNLPAEIINYYPRAKPALSFPDLDSGTDLKVITEKNEKELIVRVLEENRYNKSKTARVLNIDRKTLYNKLKQYGIEH